MIQEKMEYELLKNETNFVNQKTKDDKSGPPEPLGENAIKFFCPQPIKADFFK